MARPKGTKHKFRTPENVERVKKMAAAGLRDEQIAAIENMSESLLKEMFYHELHVGRAMGIYEVAQTAYDMAKSGKESAMTMFFLKCQGGWRERDREVEQLPPIKVVIEDYSAK